MSRIMILSDTHGSQSYIQIVLKQLERIQPNQVWHLGDDYRDADGLIDIGYRVERVPGTWTDEYFNYSIDNRIFLTVKGWRFFLTHTPESHFNDTVYDPDPEEVLNSGRIDWFCHGHTHQPKLDLQNDVWVLNPGHLKEGDNRGYPPSYAVLDVSPERIEVTIRTLLDANLLYSKVVEKA